MKKMMLGLLCLVWLMSCEIPQSVTFKGNPEVYIPLGSPFAGMADEDRLENLIDPGRIREMMNTGDEASPSHRIRIYDYQGSHVDPGLQAYLIHYPIVTMQLDLSEYTAEALKDTEDGELASFNVPAEVEDIPHDQFDSQYPNGCFLTRDGLKTSHDPNGPLFTIPLADMQKLVKEVNGTAFGVQINYRVSFEQVEVYIPAFGFADYLPGIQVGDKLQFVNAVVDPARITIIPEQDLNDEGGLDIFIKVNAPCSGNIVPEIVFEWTDAVIDTSGKGLSGDYPIENSLGDFLGSGVNFKKVDGYIYVNGVSNATMSLKIGSDIVIPAGTPLTERDQPGFSEPYTNPIPQQSLGAPIDLRGILAADGSVAILEYQIDTPTWTIFSTDSNTGVITADLIILLPLELEVTTPASNSGYVKLEMGNAFTDNPEKGDLFLRDGPDDGLLKHLDEVKILLKRLNITVLDYQKLAVLVDSDNFTRPKIIRLGDTVPYLKLSGNDLEYPFNPRFEIALERDDPDVPGSPGTFKIMRMDPDKPRVFDFFLAVEARAKIDHTIDFSDTKK